MTVAARTEDRPLPTLTFPVLMKNRPFGYIVLFTNPTKGTVVDSYNGEQCRMGEYSEKWETADNGHIWEIFEGSVTLVNKD